MLADVAFLRGDLARARALFLQAAAQADAAGDTLQVVWDLGSAALALLGDDPEAEELYRLSHENFERNLLPWLNDGGVGGRSSSQVSV